MREANSFRFFCVFSTCCTLSTWKCVSYFPKFCAILLNILREFPIFYSFHFTGATLSHGWRIDHQHTLSAVRCCSDRSCALFLFIIRRKSCDVWIARLLLKLRPKFRDKSPKTFHRTLEFRQFLVQRVISRSYLHRTAALRIFCIACSKSMQV